ncbi:MAG: hypothetical protein WCE75_06855 [Terracidiphilus sp.]
MMTFTTRRAVLAATALALVAVLARAQAPAPAGVVGTITAINGATLTVTTDKGEAVPVDVPATAVLKRVPPGQRDLSSAEPIQFSDLAVGDRAAVRLDPDSPAGKHVALRVVAMKQSDLAAKQQKDREDWQRRGVGGLVKTVDTASGAISVASGAGPTAKTVTVRTTKATILKRYAPTSVRFDAAQPAPLDAIHPGDQLRARGTKNPDGTEMDAEEVVSGSFRNISGTISSIDEASSTFTVKDLATKKPVVVHVTADATMRRLPEMMARMLAARLKGTTPAGGGGGWNGGAQQPAGAGTQRGGNGQWGGAPGGAGSGASGAPGAPGASRAPGGAWAGGAPGGGDPQQMLNRAPAIQLKDLQKGEAVMLVSTEGTAEVTAITLLGGVEPLLEAPAASQSLLSNWSMGGGGGAGDAVPQ